MRRQERTGATGVRPVSDAHPVRKLRREHRVVSDERTEDPQDDTAAEPRDPGPRADRVTGEARTAPAAQPRASDSDTTA